MIVLDEAALICDLAETYNIYDYRELRPLKVGVLACGLRDNSRIKMKLAGISAPIETMLLALIADRQEEQLYQYAQAHGKNLGTPPSILEKMIQKPDEPGENAVFDSGEDFMKTWAIITGA